MASLFFKEKDQGEYKRLERKGLGLEIRKSEWEHAWETSVLATGKEENRERKAIIFAFYFGKKPMVLRRVDDKGGNCSTQFNVVRRQGWGMAHLAGRAQLGAWGGHIQAGVMGQDFRVFHWVWFAL